VESERTERGRDWPKESGRLAGGSHDDKPDSRVALNFFTERRNYTIGEGEAESIHRGELARARLIKGGKEKKQA